MIRVSIFLDGDWFETTNINANLYFNNILICSFKDTEEAFQWSKDVLNPSSIDYNRYITREYNFA